eukprot:jgi/Hompol1/2422/HPOL_005942-RA
MIGVEHQQSEFQTSWLIKEYKTMFDKCVNSGSLIKLQFSRSDTMDDDWRKLIVLIGHISRIKNSSTTIYKLDMTAMFSSPANKPDSTIDSVQFSVISGKTGRSITSITISESTPVPNRNGWRKFATDDMVECSNLVEHVNTAGDLIVKLSVTMTNIKSQYQSSLNGSRVMNNLGCGSLLFSDFLADVNIVAPSNIYHGSDSASFVTIPAHRFILAVRSQYFAAMFRSGCKEAEQPSVEVKNGKITTTLPTIKILHFTADEIKYMLHFVYTGEPGEPPSLFEDCARLIEMADYFQLYDLHLSIGLHIIDKHTTSETCAEVYKLACKFSSVSQTFQRMAADYIDNLLSSQ